MQLAKINVAIGGDILNVVTKSDISPAEVLLLRAIHGADAVTEIQHDADVERTGAQELQRLRAYYTARNGEGGLLVDVLFPGSFAHSLPQTFEEIGVAGGRVEVVQNPDTLMPEAESEKIKRKGK